MLKEIPPIIFALGIFTFMYSRIIIPAIQHDRFAPHHIVHSFAGHIISDYWTTNPFEVQNYASNVLTVTGFCSETFVRTNRLW